MTGWRADRSQRARRAEPNPEAETPSDSPSSSSRNNQQARRRPSLPPSQPLRCQSTIIPDREAWAAAVTHLSADPWAAKMPSAPSWRRQRHSTSRGCWSWVPEDRSWDSLDAQGCAVPSMRASTSAPISRPMWDVDLVADIHRLTDVTGQESFDIIWTEAGFEHFKYPHSRSPPDHEGIEGGRPAVRSKPTRPFRSMPCRTTILRFSKDAMASLFGTKMGMHVHVVDYASPAAIYSRVDPSGHQAPSFLHVYLYAEKVARTPAEFIYEYDCLV